MTGKAIDETGNRYTRLVVLKRAENRKGRGEARWLCRCDCGNEKIVIGYSLRRGDIKSCGCLTRDHARKLKALPKGVAAFNAVVSTMKSNAKSRGYEWQLTDDQVRHLTKQPCHYCGVEPLQSRHGRRFNGAYIYNGIDRVDNTKGYVIDNVVPCCFTCNHSKNIRTVSEYKAWIDRSYRFQHSLL